MILPSSELMPVIRAALKRGQHVRMTVNGSSMLPFIHDNDIVELEPLSAPLQVGDIVLAQNTGGCYVVHRVIRAKSGIYLRGDAQKCSEGPLAPENILGKALQSERRNRIRDHAHGIWRALGLLWVYTHPSGFYFFQSYLKLRRMGGKALRQLGIIA